MKDFSRRIFFRFIDSRWIILIYLCIIPIKNKCDTFIFLIHLFIVLGVTFNLFLIGDQSTCLENIVIVFFLLLIYEWLLCTLECVSICRIDMTTECERNKGAWVY